MTPNKSFSKLANHMKTWLTYSQVFGNKPTKAEIIQDIKSIKLEDSLTILAKLSVADEDYKERLLKTLNPYIMNREFIDSVVSFDLINLAYSIKWFIAHGEKTAKFSYKNTFDDQFNVFLTVLKISDFMVEKIDSKDEVENMVLQSFLFNRPGEIDKAIIRQHEMFQNIALNKDNFKENDFVDIHSIFHGEYGYTIEYYVSILFALHQQSIKPLNTKEMISKAPWGINMDIFFDKINNKSIAMTITDELVLDLNDAKKWALDTLGNPFDYEILLSKPFFNCNGMLISLSPGFLNSTIFDGLCFKLNRCCQNAGEDFFAFFGRLFEQYVGNMLEASVKTLKPPYQYIEEFPFGKDGKSSSDAYLLLGRSLLIFECKGGRLRKETKIFADPKISQEDYTKYALKPTKQANKAYQKILSIDPNKFMNANKAFILSVSIQSFPKLPSYNEQSKELTELHPHIKFIDYISLTQFELLLTIIDYHDDLTLFKFIKDKNLFNEYVPYQNYYFEKYGIIKRPLIHNKIFSEAVELIKKTLFH